jgi:DNA-binding response OmpR family regulator/nitrogen-specific signal transduction histidine kinase
MNVQPKIVIVDDEKRMIDSLRRLLESQGYAIETFQNAQDALTHLDTCPCDLVLMDVMMPVMDGFEALSVMRERHPDITVIIMTGQASIDSAIAALRKGAYDYLSKPFDFDELIKRLNNALNHRSLSIEKNQISQKLQTTEARYQYLVNNSPDIIFTLGENDALVFISDRIDDYLPDCGDLLLGSPFLNIVHHRDRQVVQGYLEKIRSGASLASDVIEWHLKCAGCDESQTECSGLHPLMEMKAVMMSENTSEEKQDASLEIYGIIRDITQRRRAEEEKRILESQLQQAQKMEAIGTLAGGIAHDFNNLLMAIQGQISLLLMTSKRSDSQRTRLEKIESYIENGSKLTAQLLGYARKGKYEVKPIDLNKIIEDTIKTFRRMKKEVRFYVNLADDLAAIEAEPSQIVQILMNLFLNASDAMPGGGDITVTTANVDHFRIKSQLYKPRPGRYVMMSIKDTGIGMDEWTLEHIFEPFFTTKEMGRGTGLGLASVYGIVKSHQGFIEVESAVSTGTTFHVFIPASENVVEESVPMETESIVMGQGTILLVDDEEDILEIAKPMIESLGYRVIVAKSGAEALYLYPKHQKEIDLVMLDMIMPGISGGSVYDRLKSINPKVRVLLISGYSIESEAKDILFRGCDGFIQKPFRIKDLSAKIWGIIGDLQETNGRENCADGAGG